MLLIVISVCVFVIVLGMLFLKIKRGYTDKIDIVTVPVTMVFTGLVVVSITISLMGYIISILSLFK